MQKWEYRWICVDSATYEADHKADLKRIEALGLEGWEAVGFDEDHNGYRTVLLKRPLPTE